PPRRRGNASPSGQPGLTEVGQECPTHRARVGRTLLSGPPHRLEIAPYQIPRYSLAIGQEAPGPGRGSVFRRRSGTARSLPDGARPFGGGGRRGRSEDRGGEERPQRDGGNPAEVHGRRLPEGVCPVPRPAAGSDRTGEDDKRSNRRAVAPPARP